MLKRISFILSAILLVAQTGFPARAQGRRANRPAKPRTSQSSAREQDRLVGPVRRVRTEIAKILIKSGKPVEGPRVLRELITYDSQGNKTDSAYYPIEGDAPAGKEEYVYDDKGNIKEMILRHQNGTVLSRELYDYEFDDVGNWIKMVTRVTVIEGGKLKFEPAEATYRTITYYYNQTVAKAARPVSPAAATTTTAPKENSGDQIVSEADAETRPSPDGAATTTTTSPPKAPDNKNVTPQPALAAINAEVKPVTSGAAGAAPSSDPTGNKATEDPSPIKPDSGTSEVPAPKLPVKRVTSEVLNSAILSLPQPAYPSMAMFARVEGKVDVQVIVDEKGEVSAARAVSGHPLLNDAAEGAARRARFSPTLLSREPAKVFGVITYTFDLSAESAAPQQPRAAPLKSSSAPNAATTTTTAAPADAATSYRTGLSHYSAGRYQEAVSSLRQATAQDPLDAAAHATLGLAYSALGRHKEAAASLNEALRLKREVLDAEAYYTLGEAHRNLNQPQQAIEFFTQAVYMVRASAASSIEPGRRQLTLAEAHYGLGMAYYDAKLYEQAVGALEEAVLQEPQVAQAHYALGMAYIRHGDRDSAVKQQQVLKELKSPLADRLADALSAPKAQVNRGF